VPPCEVSAVELGEAVAAGFVADDAGRDRLA
jgi:hypothetical protein